MLRSPCNREGTTAAAGSAAGDWAGGLEEVATGEAEKGEAEKGAGSEAADLVVVGSAAVRAAVVMEEVA